MMKTDNPNPSGKPRPLEGIRVVEYGLFHAGPGATAILGDLGAEVIKIETRKGDGARFWTQIADLDIADPTGESIIFQVSSRNKRGICLDIHSPEGRSVFNRLVRQADVFMTNLRKSTKEKLAIDYASIATINPRIIHASVSGYGTEGPLSDIGAFDPLGQACSGLMFVTGSDTPRPLNVGLLDQATAIALSHAIITALFVRERQGIAQDVHVSLYSTALWLQHINMMLSSGLSKTPTAPMDRDQHSPLRNVFRCKDGKWIMGTHHPEEKYWTTFCRAVGKPELLEDPEFTDSQQRPKNVQKLTAIFDAVFATKTQMEWMAVFQTHKMMFAPIQRIEDVEKDPQALQNNYLIPLDYPDIGQINILGYPIHFGACQTGFQRRAPRVGEHTQEVLEELGYSSEEIENLRKNAVIN